MKCQSRILKDYKTKKSDCMWPESIYGPTEVGTLEVCGGDVTLKLRAVDEPYYGGCSAKMELEAVCTRCKHPYFPGRIGLDYKVDNHEGFDITALFDRGTISE